MTTSITVNILTGVFEAIVIFLLLDEYIDKNPNVPNYKSVFAVISLAILINLSNIVLDLGMPNFIFVILSTFVIAYIYKRHLKMCIILSIISVLILAISEIIVVFLVSLALRITVNEAAEIDEYIILGTILSKFFAFIVVKIICMKHRNNVLSMKTSYWVLFLIICISSVITIFLIYRLQYENHSTELYDLSVWCSLGLLYSTFFSLYLYERIARNAELERQQEIFTQQIRAQTKHLDEILITHKELKKLKHDLVNHNISIQAYFERQDYKSGLEYIKNMNVFTQTLEDAIDTGNVALDAIINTKKSIAVSKGIEFITNVQIPENIFVDAIDICIIFGNALDNCIEACDRLENSDRKISVSIIYDNDCLICKIANTAMKSNNEFLHTIKSDGDNHGFGIRNIESALARYKNVCQFNQTDDEFILSFVIFKN